MIRATHHIFSLFLLTLFTLICTVSPSTIYASTLPSGFVEEQVASGMVLPTSMAFAPDGRLFINEKPGKVRIRENGVFLPTPFLTIAVNDASERGLLGIAFDPNFTTNRYLYLYYTRAQEPIKNRISRFQADPNNPNLALAGSETILLDNIPSDSGIHNGGALHFGKDGKLYAAIGDGGQTSNNAQNLGILSGKIIRINPDGTIPADNPFFASLTARKEVWAYGLRNPFTFAVHPSTGRILINDVGQALWEEINDGQAGKNYGWPVCEGTCATAGMTNPLFVFPHPDLNAITGGTFYTGTQFPASYSEKYFYADYVHNTMWSITPTAGQTSSVFGTDLHSPVDILTASDGSLYYLSVLDGSAYRIRYAPSATPTPTPSPSPTPSPNTPPAITFGSPDPTMLYSAGDTIHFDATATDSEDGDLPATAFTWNVIFHHDDHTHPFLTNLANTKSGEFTVPATGEHDPDVYYEITLKVTDSAGKSTTSSRTVNPKKSLLKFITVPAGLSLTLDGQPISTPYETQSVVGHEHQIEAPANQQNAGTSYLFSTWSDSSTIAHTIQTPATETTYTATYTVGSPTPDRTPGLLATYFNEMNFTGKAIQRVDPTVNFDWAFGSPDPAIDSETFSARWTGFLTPQYTGEYTFTVSSDDGTRLWVDGKQIISAWLDQAEKENSGKITLTAGQPVTIRLEYFDRYYHAVAKLYWSGPNTPKQILPSSVVSADTSTTGSGLYGIYYNEANLAGSSSVRIDPQINFNWMMGKPKEDIDPDTFSVRWLGYISAPEDGLYTFFLTGDDGIRLFVNDTNIIDAWIDQSATTHTGQIQLSKGVKYFIRLEYYENGWDAVTKLEWQSGSVPRSTIPTTSLYPTY